jgi:hypothetical protein
MRTVSAALLQALGAKGNNPYVMADLYTITLNDGSTVYRWTDFDQTLTYAYGGQVFLAQGPLLHRSRLGVKNTVEVPELTIKLAALDTDFIGGLSVKTQIHNGYFDGATVALDRIYMTTPGDTTLGVVGAYTSGSPLLLPGGMFSGRMSGAKITAVGAELTVKGANVLMNQMIPRNLYQLPCLHTFCDAGCTLVKATYTTTNTVGASPTVMLIPWGSVPGTPSIYTLGKITFTSGPAIGQIRTIKNASAAGLLLQYPLYNLPIAGDTFSVLQGCDKTYNSGSGQSCSDRSNTQHFRGFPFIPTSETAF